MNPNPKGDLQFELEPSSLIGGGFRGDPRGSQPPLDAPQGSVTCPQGTVTCLGKQQVSLLAGASGPYSGPGGGACSATFPDNKYKHRAPPCQPPQALAGLVTPGGGTAGDKEPRLVSTHSPAHRASC